ncbi:MAG: SPOR domain-containing protein [Thiotrichaceae bacterium]|nr:SPOR domain-containing protein [Thiotrichaceae bacterium]
MSNNVVQKIDKPELSVVASPDAQADLFNGQQQPAPYLHDPAVFNDAPSAYYLKTDALASLMAHVQNAVSGHGPMQVIIAEHGRGKSSLIRQLISEVGNRWQLCYIHADYQLGVDHIIDALGQVFLAQKGGDFEALVKGLIRYDTSQLSPVVIVDDAQNISPYGLETLATIKRTVTEQGGNIDFILCASLALRKNLTSYGMSSFKGRWFEVHRLPRFSEEDTLAYLKARFENSQATEFTPSQLQIIYRRGCGIPACINYHAELALGQHISDERLRLEHQQMQKRQKKIPYFMTGAATLLLLLVSTVFMLSNAEPERLVDHTAIASLPSSSESPASVEQTVAAAKVAEQASDPKPVVKAAVVEKPKPVPKPIAKPTSKPVVAKAAPKPVPVVADKPKPALTTVAKPVPVAKPAAIVKKHGPVAAVAATPAKAVKASSDGAIPGAVWLKAQPEDYYSIQLAGSPSEKDIVRYITRSSLDGELAYVLLKRKNRSSWYVVLHGSFSSRAEAKRIVEFFPPELRKNQPWIRQFSKLRNALDES